MNPDPNPEFDGDALALLAALAKYAGVVLFLTVLAAALVFSVTEA